MSNINQRITELKAQLREMRLKPEELENLVAKYKDDESRTGTIIHTAATLLCLEVEFGGRS